MVSSSLPYRVVVCSDHILFSVGLFVLLKHGNWQHYYAAEIISCNIDGLVRLEWFKHNCYLDSDEPPPPTNFVVTQSSCYSALMRPWNRYEVVRMSFTRNA